MFHSDTIMVCLFCRQLIYNYPEQLFSDAGVMAIEHADFEGVERLALVTGQCMQLVCSCGMGMRQMAFFFVCVCVHWPGLDANFWIIS